MSGLSRLQTNGLDGPDKQRLAVKEFTAEIHNMKQPRTIWNNKELVRHSRSAHKFTTGDKHVSTA
jgi:hypothetical protein